MIALRCPVCGGSLNRSGRVWRCSAGHSFDIARQGYVNLLLRGGSGKRHGDDKTMVAARTAFLDRGFYDPLSQALAELALAHSAAPRLLLDAGCGEGKYTCDLLRALRERGDRISALGIDISREALIAAARRDRELTLAVASTAALPVADGAADILLNVFSPFAREEFHRVLKPGGLLLRAWPLERHLWELKELIYETPYPNPPLDPAAEGFALLETRALRYPITLNGAEIGALFRMTPYYYKTGRTDQEKAERAERLTVELQFGVGAYVRADA